MIWIMIRTNTETKIQNFGCHCGHNQWQCVSRASKIDVQPQLYAHSTWTFCLYHFELHFKWPMSTNLELCPSTSHAHTHTWIHSLNSHAEHIRHTYTHTYRNNKNCVFHMFSLLFSCGTIYGTIIIFWRLCKASHAHRVFLLHCCCCCVDEMYPCQVQTKHSRNWLIRKNQRNERIRDGIEWFVINMQAAPVSGDWTPITPNSIQLSFFWFVHSIVVIDIYPFN